MKPYLVAAFVMVAMLLPAFGAQFAVAAAPLERIRSTGLRARGDASSLAIGVGHRRHGRDEPSGHDRDES